MRIAILPTDRYEAKLKVTEKLKDEDGERIIEEDIEHASVSFVVK